MLGGDLNGEDIQKTGHICISIAELLFSTAETSTL